MNAFICWIDLEAPIARMLEGYALIQVQPQSGTAKHLIIILYI